LNPLNFSKTNWKKFSRLVETSCHDINAQNISSKSAIDHAICRISSSINESLISSTPRKKQFVSRYKFSQHVDLLIRNRNYFRNLYKRTLNPSFKSSVNQLNRLIRNQIRKEKSIDYEYKLKNLSFVDNSLFQYSKFLKRKRQIIPPIKDGARYCYSDSDKAEAFARSFKSSFSISQNANSKFESLVDKSIRSLMKKNISDAPQILNADVKSILASLNPKKAFGPDKIPNLALLCLSKSNLFTSLCTGLFNACLNLSYFPDSWKIAKIFPVSKSNPAVGDVDKFRPISLLSCFGKCFEKIILERLNDFEADNNIFINQQCGFRTNHTTVHQILIIVEDVSFGFNNNKSTAMALLDLRKAFDSVWHNGLLHKLVKAGYPIYIVRLIYSYLNSRQAYVSLGSYKSNYFAVLSGVPQGSLISPHLFNLFINDIPLPSQGKLALFADDTSITVQVPWKNLKSAKNSMLNSLRKV